jgi:hypothetical protein
VTFNERHNDVMKFHAAFLNAVGVAAAGGGGFVAITNSNWGAAFLFLMLSLSLHIAATEVLERMRVEP